ncbi:MAG: hypothetical protein WDA42_06075 [Candidatus Bathyarchaeia archaeon]
MIPATIIRHNTMITKAKARLEELKVNGLKATARETASGVTIQIERPSHKVGNVCRSFEVIPY